MLNKLERLKIPMPNYTQFEGSERSLYLVAYLSAMEQLARRGDLWVARGSDIGEMVMQPGVRKESD